MAQHAGQGLTLTMPRPALVKESSGDDAFLLCVLDEQVVSGAAGRIVVL